MSEQYCIVYMYLIFSIHLSVLVHLSCSPVLAIVPSAAMIFGVQVSFKILLFIPDLLLGIGFLGHWVLLYLVCKRTSIMFSQTGVPIYIPTNSIRGFFSLHTRCRIYCCRFLMWPFWPMWGDITCVIPHMVHLICFSQRTSDAECLFMCFMTVSMTSLEKHVFRSLADFFVEIFFF